MKEVAEREPLPGWGEPWLKAWLVLLPLVVWASHALMTNQWRRAWEILNPDSPDAAAPTKLWWYAAMVGIGFSFVYLGVARLFRSSQTA